jgi:pimeloyl-ACP methyl ester carboxylesterase
VLRLVDHLGLDQWLVFGVSYGTLPVLALAALAPRRVLSAGLFGTYLHERWCAQDVTTQAGFKSDNALLHLVGRRWPSALFPWMRGFGMMSPAQVMGRFEDASLPQTERALLHPAHPYHQRFARLWAECGQRGFWYLAQGWSLAINQPPGFTLEQVDAGGASLFVETGEHDNVHLPRMSAFVAERVRAAKLNVVTGNGRLGCVSERLEAGLSRFLSRGAAPAP